jgi:hypothetical protein
MSDTAQRGDSSLAEFLAARARRASDTRLAIDALAGLSFAAAVAWWNGPGAPFLVSIGACFFAYGVWGITDRELGERPDAARGVRASLRALRAVAAVLGFAAAGCIAVLALAKALGVMIS